MSHDAKIAEALTAANQYLKQVNAKVALVRRGQVLYWQGTFPPKPGSKRDRPYQQKFSSGFPVTKTGINRAKRQAVIIGNALVEGSFDWSNYIEIPAQSDHAEALISKFEKHYRRAHSLQDSTWANDWLKWLKRLPLDKPLSAERLIDAALTTEENTAGRSRCCLRLQSLADFAGVEVDLLKYKGSYGRGKQKARELPSDSLIQEWCSTEFIPNPKWRNVLGLMAAYGLRPHEAFLGELRDDGQYFVREGKTGPRLVRPFYPEWPDMFKLWGGELPAIDVERARRIGNLGRKINTQFRKYRLPTQPYNLRHAYAVRMHVTFNLPESIGAKLMGHALDEHMRTYQKWLDEARMEAAIARILESEDRPRPPSF